MFPECLTVYSAEICYSSVLLFTRNWPSADGLIRLRSRVFKCSHKENEPNCTVYLCISRTLISLRQSTDGQKDRKRKGNEVGPKHIRIPI